MAGNGATLAFGASKVVVIVQLVGKSAKIWHNTLSQTLLIKETLDYLASMAPDAASFLVSPRSPVRQGREEEAPEGQKGLVPRRRLRVCYILRAEVLELLSAVACNASGLKTTSGWRVVARTLWQYLTERMCQNSVRIRGPTEESPMPRNAEFGIGTETSIFAKPCTIPPYLIKGNWLGQISRCIPERSSEV